jgi:hypothetical protein
MANLSKSRVPQFSVDVYQNVYLPEGGTEVDAIVTVTATGGGTIGGAAGAPPAPGLPRDPRLPDDGRAEGTRERGPEAAVVIMMDCSGSMDYPPTKLRHAREATTAAIGTLRDGVRFAVVGGTSTHRW